MKNKRYTLVFHDYIGYGSYVINIKRTYCGKETLKRYLGGRNGQLHFIISGWPSIQEILLDILAVVYN